MITIDDDIRHACHVAALRAIDDVLSKMIAPRNYWIKDSHLPDLLPAIDRAIDAALRETPLPGQCKP